MYTWKKYSIQISRNFTIKFRQRSIYTWKKYSIQISRNFIIKFRQMDLDTDWPILSILSRKICKRHFIYFLDTLRFSWTSAVKECFCFLFFSFCDGKECLTWANVLITNILTEGLAVWRHILHLPATGGRPTPAVPVQSLMAGTGSWGCSSAALAHLSS